MSDRVDAVTSIDQYARTWLAGPRSDVPATMTPERWQRVQAIFDAACDLPVDERGALLDRACEGDAALRAEVESLLDAAFAGAEGIGDIIGREAARTVEAAAPPTPGRRLGPYRLVRELGEGGMGAVYLAVRDDDQYRTEVAIKLLHRGLETAHAVARFRDERQILATLEHTGIVRLLDGGSTPEGLPYLVMEHVEGAPITRFADDRDLGVSARVALFRDVCAAVAYAHRKLVVHRDLKPSNILVTADGAPKLLDFGIAKLLDPTAGVGREAQTRTGMRLLTPEYASPEQVRGEPASTSTDVYSLGAVLFELLTGALPLKPTGNDLEALRTVLEVDPPRPSSVAPPARRRALAGDLDNIVLKALHKDPGRRYASVEALSDDLGRHLDGLPVLARTATFSYRAGKFLRRHRGLIAALTVVLVSLGASTVVSLRQARRADEQARLADEHARRAQKRFDDVRRLANAMLFEVDGQLQNLAGATEARAVIVGRAREYLDSLAGEAADDAELARELAEAYVKIGDIQGGAQGPNLGRPADALANYAKARQLLDPLVAAGRSDASTRWTLVRALHGAALVETYERGHDVGLPLLREASRIVDAQPRDATFDHQLAALLYIRLGLAAVDRGDPAAAERDAKACFDIASQWAEASGSPDARYWLGVAHEMTATVRTTVGDPEGAIVQLNAAREIFGALVAEHPQNAAYRRELWNTLHLLGPLHSGVWGETSWPPSTGDRVRAEAAQREGLAVAEHLADKDANDTRAAAELVAALDQLAATLAERDPAAALPLFERARAVVAAMPASARESPYVTQYEWLGHCWMAVPLAELGRRDAAIAALDRGLALAKHEAELDRIDMRLSRSFCRYQGARVHQELGDPDTAIRLLAESAAELRPTLAARPFHISPYIGLVAVLELHAALVPERRCEYLAQAAAVWSSWPGASTAYIERRRAELAVAACSRAEG